MTTMGHGPITVREAVVEVLRSAGMTAIFGNPGSTELPMFRDFPADFTYHLGLQESIVLAMADGYAQATRNAAAVNLHSAAGVGHAMGSLFTAYRNRTPLVIIAGQQARSLLGGEPYLFSDRAAELPRPYVKWSSEPARPQDVPAAIARAYHVAMAAPRGPAYVSVPADDWDHSAEPVPVRRVGTAQRPDPEQLARLAGILARAERPAFVVGAAVDQDDAFDDVVALAEAHQARVWAAPMSSRCSFPETHPLFAGFLPPVREQIVAELTGHDAVVSLGAPIFTYHVAGAGPHLPPATTFFQITDDPQMAAWTPIGDALVAGVRLTVRELLAVPPLVERPAPPRRAMPEPAPEPTTITQRLLMTTLARLRPANSVIYEEAPSSRPVMCEHLPNERPESFYTCASGSLGHSLPAAVGMALGRADQRVIAVIGDGSAMYSIQALWTAAQLMLPMTILIVSNGGYATVDRFARRFGIEKAVGTTVTGLDLPGLARSQGCRAAAVDRPDELPAALGTALASPVPYLLDVRVTD